MRSALLLIFALALACPVSAEEGPASKEAPVVSEPSTAVVPLDPAKKRAQELDRLFAALHADPVRDAPGIERKIWAAFMRNDSPTAEVLVGQATIAMNEGALDAAESILEKAIETYPEFIEATNKRGALYLKQQRYDEALEDFAKVLEEEPRHFGALAGRGMAYHGQGKLPQALEAFREALAVHPHMEVVKVIVKQLEHDVPGI